MPRKRLVVILLFLACMVAPLALYVFTAAPCVTLVDAGELALAAHTLGIGHPPGFPVYIMLAHAFSRLPLGNDVAHRVTLFSSFCAALAAGFAFLLFRQLMLRVDWQGEPAWPRNPLAPVWRRIRERRAAKDRHARRRSERAKPKAEAPKPKQEPEPVWRPALQPPLWPAVAGALIFGCSLCLWQWATVTEVYALNIALVTLMMWLAARGDWAKAALTESLALGVHDVTAGLALPAAFYLAWTARRPTRRDWWAAAALFAVGLLAYLYLPLRAGRSPFDWGDPRTPLRLWWHVTGRQYAELGLTDIARLTWSVGYLAGLWWRQFAVPGSILAAWGAVALYYRSRRLFWFAALTVLPNVAFTLAYGIREDVEGYYLPTFLVWAWCFAFGAAALAYMRPFRSAAWRRFVLAMAVLALVALPAVKHFPQQDRSRDRIAPLYVQNTINSATPGSLILTSDWELYSPWLYRRYAEGYRPDIALLQAPMLRCSWYLDYLQREYPYLMQAVGGQLAAYRKQLDSGGPCDASPAHNAAVAALLEALVRARIASRAPVYMTWNLDRYLLDNPFLGNLVLEPRGILYRVIPGEKPELTRPEVELDLAGLADGTAPMDFVKWDLRKMYAHMLATRADYLLSADITDAAIFHAQAALKLDRDQELAHQVLNGMRSRVARPSGR